MAVLRWNLSSALNFQFHNVMLRRDGTSRYLPYHETALSLLTEIFTPLQHFMIFTRLPPLQWAESSQIKSQ